MMLFFSLLIFLNLSQGARIILYSDNNLYAMAPPYPFSPVGDADTLCGTIRSSSFPSLSCSATVPFLAYTTRAIADLPSLYGFSPTASVVGPTGIAIGSWSTVATGGTISNSMFGAGVINAASTTFYTGSTTSGTAFFNCVDYSDNSGIGITGIIRLGGSSLTSSSWKTDGTTGCDVVAPNRFICVCVETTAAPTKSPTLIIPTSKSPTTAAPTTKTPTQFPVSPTTQTVTFYSDNVEYSTSPPSVWAPSANADTLCGTIRTSTYPSLQCSSTTAFLGYTTRAVNSLPSLLGFSSSARVLGPTGLEISPSWDILFTNSPASNFLTRSMYSGGVFNNAIGERFATGADGAGNTLNNCGNWATFSPTTMTTGDTLSQTEDWIFASDVTSCVNSVKFACLCVGPTPSPTKNPTLNPTRNPTSKKPTSNPTKNPTLKPTTVTPTKAPTTPIPSLNPTLSPQINRQLGEVVYRLRQGNTAEVRGVLGSSNISYSVIDPGEVTQPTNVTLRGAVLEPIKWVSVVYRKFDPATNLTVTATISQCNPVANPVQGTTPNGFNGLRTCPSIRRCANCTVSLSPAGTTWTTPRACICSYEVVVREDLGDLDLTTRTGELQMIKLVAEPTNPTPVEDGTLDPFIVGDIQCNSFIERELNCQFVRFVPGYVPQCTSQPISCFNFTLGYAFGAFWDQNPKFQYNIPRANWTEAHYRGIASTINNKTYSLGGELVDPYLPSVQKDYYWFVNVTSLDVLSKSISAVDFSYVPEISQAEPYSYQAGVRPPPSTLEEITYPFTAAIDACILSLALSSTTGCAGLIWEGLDYLQWREPGYIEYLPITAGEIVYSLDITTTYNFSGIQLYNVAGELCGQVLRPLGSDSTTTRISCVSSTNNTITTGGYLQVRFLGVSNFWDIPGEKLTSSLPTLRDTLVSWGVVSSLYSTSEYINLIYGMAYAFFNLGVLLVDISLSFPHLASKEGLFVYSSTYQLNYGEVTAGSTDITSQWDEVANLILNNNSYPRNTALEARVLVQGYTTNPVSYSSREDLDYLYRFWATWLAPRLCSEDTPCRTFGLGKCIFSESILPSQYWYNGDVDSPGYDLPPGVQEGGCLVYSSWEQGYYDSYLFGATCKPGYGPLSIDQWGKILQYNATIAKTLPNEFPFNVTISSPAQFERDLACKFPVGKDPLNAPFVDFNMCGGHGEVEFSSSLEGQFELPFYIYKQFYLTPQCTGLSYKGEYYTFNGTLDIFNLQYVSSSYSIISIVNEVVYLNGSSCLFTSTQSLPTVGLLSCAGDSGEDSFEVACFNPYLFSTSSLSFSLGRLTAWSPWVVYFTI